jgi:uncharacterized protein (TIGR03437 family)
MTYSFNGLPLPILPSSANVTTLARIVVPNEIKMTKVTAQVLIQYPNSGDLKVFLFSPQGTRTILLQNNCSVVNVDTTFDDSASSQWSSFCPVEAGRGPFRPNQPLSNFNSDNSSFGVWTLAVTNDKSNSRSGWITQFSITITGVGQLGPVTSPTAIVNAASLSGTGTIAPGEMISIFGAAIGPNPAVSAPSGAALPTSLGGTSVTIDGTPAPIAYASLFRVDVQVPFTLAPTGTTSSIVVVTGGGTSTPVPLTVVNASPGVYTNSTGGPGPAVATNQDGSLNSASNPAAKGSIVLFYASGLGAVSPALAEGMVPPDSPLSSVVGEVGAFIGGVPAAVQFAGLAPGFPGLYQLNIQVPATAPSGAADLVIYSNGVPSQSGVTIQIQ